MKLGVDGLAWFGIVGFGMSKKLQRFGPRRGTSLAALCPPVLFIPPGVGFLFLEVVA